MTMLMTTGSHSDNQIYPQSSFISHSSIKAWTWVWLYHSLVRRKAASDNQDWVWDTSSPWTTVEHKNVNYVTSDKTTCAHDEEREK